MRLWLHHLHVNVKERTKYHSRGDYLPGFKFDGYSSEFQPVNSCITYEALFRVKNIHNLFFNANDNLIICRKPTLPPWKSYSNQGSHKKKAIIWGHLHWKGLLGYFSRWSEEIPTSTCTCAFFARLPHNADTIVIHPWVEQRGLHSLFSKILVAPICTVSSHISSGHSRRSRWPRQTSERWWCLPLQQTRCWNTINKKLKHSIPGKGGTILFCCLHFKYVLRILFLPNNEWKVFRAKTMPRCVKWQLYHMSVNSHNMPIVRHLPKFSPPQSQRLLLLSSRRACVWKHVFEIHSYIDTFVYR